MPSRWFRIAYSRNAFLRFLGEQGLELEALTVTRGVRAMIGFFEQCRPQHGERDWLEVTWGPSPDGYEFSVVRRMQRHGHPEAPLSLVFTFAPRGDSAVDGSAPISRWQDVTDLPGYAVIRGARPLRRRVDQS